MLICPVHLKGTACDFLKSVRGIQLTLVGQLFSSLASASKMGEIPPHSNLNCGQVTFESGEKRYFCNVASMGISSLVLQSMSRHPRLCKALKASPVMSFVYPLWTVVLLLFSTKWKRIELQCSTANFKVVSTFACLAIGSCFGGGISVSPSSNPSSPTTAYFQQIRLSWWQNVLLWPLLILALPLCLVLRLLECRLPLHLLCSEHKYSDKITISSNMDDIAIECDGELVGNLPATLEVILQSLPWISFG